MMSASRCLRGVRIVKLPSDRAGSRVNGQLAAAASNGFCKVRRDTLCGLAFLIAACQPVCPAPAIKN